MSSPSGKKCITALAKAALVILADELGSGGQATVRRGLCNGKPVAVKVFHQQYATAEFALQIEKVVYFGTPGSWFAWPVDYLWDGSTLAVVMPLMPADHCTIADLLSHREQPPFAVVIQACFNLVAAFLAMHARGLCYLDINRNNVSFSPRTGKIAICDNENVAVNRSGYPSLFTPRYAAPEVGRGSGCSIDTDLHSLGVVLFELLFLSHPFEGRNTASKSILRAEDVHRLYCEQPVFVFNPTDESNRPDPKLHAEVQRYWRIYPTFLRDLFIRHFTHGIVRSQSDRVREVEWRDAFVALLDAVFWCTCGAEVFFDAAINQQACWNCRQPLRTPMRLRFHGGHEVVLVPGKTLLFSHHIGESRFDFSRPLARVVIDRSGQRIGLKNESSQEWSAKLSGRDSVNVLPGETLEISLGAEICFPAGDAIVVE